MYRKVRKLSILSQLLLFILPLVALIVFVGFYFQYSKSLDQLIIQEEQRKENIREGSKLFIDNYDLSLQLIEKEIEARITNLSTEILAEHSSNLINANLDSLSQLLGMDKSKEDLYIIDRNGVVISTTKKIDLGLNFYAFGASYKTFLEDVWSKKTLVIERVATESKTKISKKYAYQAIDNNYILEIGVQFASIDNIIENFSTKTREFTNRYSNIKSVDLFAATESLPPRNLGAIMEEDVKPVAIECFKNKKDTSIIAKNGGSIKTDLIYMEMRSSVYFKGYILQIISDDSLKRALLITEFTNFLLLLIVTLALISIVLYFVTKKITQPIRYLTTKVSQVSIGEDVPEIKVKGSSETEFLGNEFSKMGSKVNKYQSTLESKVEERTEQLNLRNEELKKLLDERSLLIKEIHHRVKNNLQIISSLLNLQSQSIKSKEDAVAFENSKNRVVAMALLHEKLYKDTNFVSINSTSYLQDLIDALKDVLSSNVTITIKRSDVVFNSTESIAIGLITNEAITNALKHGFNEGERGIIEIEVNDTESDIVLKIFNDGKKLAEDYANAKSETLGMTIISAFSEKLDGTHTLHNFENGVLLTVTFPKTFD